MAVKLPSKGPRYTIKEAAKKWQVSRDSMYKAIAAGTLRAKVLRGRKRGYVVDDEIMDDWFENGYDDVFETIHGGVAR